MKKLPPRLAWAAFLALSALGYILFVGLATRPVPEAPPRWSIDRAAAIEAVRNFASEQRSQVSPPQGWLSRWRSERVIGEDHDEGVGRYLRSHPGPAEELMRRLVPALRAHAQHRTPEGELFEVWLDSQGRRVGFRRLFPDEPAPSGAPVPPPSDSGGDAGRERAQEIARASLLGRLESPDAISFQLEDVEEDRSLPGPPIHIFTWEGRHEELPELTVEAVIAVRDEARVSERLSLELDSDPGLRPVLVGLAIVVLMLLALAYTTLRLVRRAREGEVSRSRGFVLGGIFLVSTAILPFFVDAALSRSDPLLNLLGAAFGATFGALFFAFTWIALEGDVREALPDKLTAFDTLLSGRLWSRDVARSSLVGIALAGPALGLLETTRLLPGAGTGIADKLAELFSASVPLLALYVQPVVLMIGVVIFVPLSFLLRWNRSPKRALVQLAALFPALSLALLLLDPDTGVPETVYVVAAAAFILAPFLFHDLLAALWTGYAMVVVPRILCLVLQPSAALEADGWAATAVAGLGLAAIVSALAWGRTYTAEEVRPVYAMYLAERLELLAEKKLADEAHDRLLPSTLPEIPGLALAASCHRGEAGDCAFYDLLALPDDRLGIAVVGIEDQGAAAALRLALLKGLLKTSSLRTTSPRAVLEGLQRGLRFSPPTPQGAPEAPGGAPGMRFAGVYAVYDPSSRRLFFTRRGEAAALFLRRSGGEVAALEGADASDTEVVLDPGDALIFAYGDSVLAAADDRGSPTLSSALSGLEHGGANALRASLYRLTTAVDAQRDQALVVVATTPEGSNRRMDLEK